jgi:voltage-gated potassium channel
MVIGHSLIILPTRVLPAELVGAARRQITSQHCPECTREGHDVHAAFCKCCGGSLLPGRRAQRPSLAGNGNSKQLVTLL